MEAKVPPALQRGAAVPEAHSGEGTPAFLREVPARPPPRRAGEGKGEQAGAVQGRTCSHCTPSAPSPGATCGGGSACGEEKRWVWSSWTTGCPRRWRA